MRKDKLTMKYFLGRAVFFSTEGLTGLKLTRLDSETNFSHYASVNYALSANFSEKGMEMRIVT